MKLEDARKLQVIFESNLNQISKASFKSKEQKRSLENIKLLSTQDKLLLNCLMNIL